MAVAVRGSRLPLTIIYSSAIYTLREMREEMGAKKDVKMFMGGLMLLQDDFYVLKGRRILLRLVGNTCTLNKKRVV